MKAISLFHIIAECPLAGIDEKELPLPNKYPEHTLELMHQRRRAYYITAADEDDKKEWVEMFQTCCRKATGKKWPSYSIHIDAVIDTSRLDRLKSIGNTGQFENWDADRLIRIAKCEQILFFIHLRYNRNIDSQYFANHFLFYFNFNYIAIFLMSDFCHFMNVNIRTSSSATVYGLGFLVCMQPSLNHLF